MRWASAILFAALAAAQTRQVALTFDDAPRGGDSPSGRQLTATLTLTQELIRQLDQIPATIFANPGQARELSEEGVDQILRLWHDSGFTLGNHTFSHADLNKIPLAEYQAEILRAEPALRRGRGGAPSRYFRHTFLHTGSKGEIRDALTAFLTEHKLIAAPVTMDGSDWLFARVYATWARATADPAGFRRRYLDYLDQQISYAEQAALALFQRPIAHILLLHVNQLNADSMPDLLALLARRGYSVIALEQALRDAAYQSRDDYAGPEGLSWLRRWAYTRSIPLPPEPVEPADILSAYRKQR